MAALVIVTLVDDPRWVAAGLGLAYSLAYGVGVVVSFRRAAPHAARPATRRAGPALRPAAASPRCPPARSPGSSAGRDAGRVRQPLAPLVALVRRRRGRGGVFVRAGRLLHIQRGHPVTGVCVRRRRRRPRRGWTADPDRTRRFGRRGGDAGLDHRPRSAVRHRRRGRTRRGGPRTPSTRYHPTAPPTPASWRPGRRPQRPAGRGTEQDGADARRRCARRRSPRTARAGPRAGQPSPTTVPAGGGLPAGTVLGAALPPRGADRGAPGHRSPGGPSTRCCPAPCSCTAAARRPRRADLLARPGGRRSPPTPGSCGSSTRSTATESDGPATGDYIVCEYANGQSLEVLLSHGPLSGLEAAWVVREVADALAGVHSAGLGHERINPDNVVITPSGNVRIVGLVIEEVLRPTPTLRRTGRLPEARTPELADVPDLGPAPVRLPGRPLARWTRLRAPGGTAVRASLDDAAPGPGRSGAGAGPHLRPDPRRPAATPDGSDHHCGRRGATP